MVGLLLWNWAKILRLIIDMKLMRVDTSVSISRGRVSAGEQRLCYRPRVDK